MHPRISEQERRYIEGSVVNQVVGNEGMPVPWKSILTSWPAWAIGITTFGRIWVHYVFIIPGPMYMKTILNFKIQTVSTIEILYLTYDCNVTKIFNEHFFFAEWYPVWCTIHLQLLEFSCLLLRCRFTRDTTDNVAN